MKHFPTHLQYSLDIQKELGINLDALDQEKFNTDAVNRILLGIFQLYERWCQVGINFYSQPLALWMFVPCGEDGEPIVKPEAPEQPYDEDTDVYFQYTIYLKRWEAAEQRVMFEGWELSRRRGGAIEVWRKGEKSNQLLTFDGGKLVTYNCETIEDLVHRLKHDNILTPTQSAKKQLNIKED